MYRDQSYYKEFRDLVSRLRSGVSQLKKENARLLNENDALSRELRDVRALLAETRREVDHLKNNSVHQPVNDETSDILTDKSSAHDDENNKPPTNSRSAEAAAPPLFGNLSDNERIALRQQINELIQKIDRHLATSENS